MQVHGEFVIQERRRTTSDQESAGKVKTGKDRQVKTGKQHTEKPIKFWVVNGRPDGELLEVACLSMVIFFFADDRCRVHQNSK